MNAPKAAQIVNGLRGATGQLSENVATDDATTWDIPPPRFCFTPGREFPEHGRLLRFQTVPSPDALIAIEGFPAFFSDRGVQTGELFSHPIDAAECVQSFVEMGMDRQQELYIF